MGWVEDALKKTEELEKKKNSEVIGDNQLNLKNNLEREGIKKELKKLYENATDREIDKAIEYGIEKLGIPCAKNDFFKTIRIKLED